MKAVVDASLLAEMLIGSPRGRAAEAMLPSYETFHLPDLAGPETASVARGWLRGGLITLERAQQLVGDLPLMRARVWPTAPLLERAWELRDNATIYDAVYVALAERLGATLLTGDERLERGLKTSARCEILLVANPGPPTTSS
ncbi:MAG: type II toxin-antitoxin system VapC family toxin [Bifidobacteriaceae bacterium]|nr:type II toxin-antitoxin system VapC family toxin [Bifidobacteriaceae bacterium]